MPLEPRFGRGGKKMGSKSAMLAGFPSNIGLRGPHWVTSRNAPAQRLAVKQIFLLAILGPLALAFFCATASADQTPFGYLSYDVTVPGMTAAFDITYQTGPNSKPFPDPTWPVATPLPITSLTVDFNSGSSTVFGPAYFTLVAGGLSWFGNSLDISGGNPEPHCRRWF
jgi:hypothetical protein